MAFIQKMEELRNSRMEDGDFISDDVFEEKVREQNREAIPWRDLPTQVIFKILEVLEVDGMNGKSKILTLKESGGKPMKVWACSTLGNKEKDALQGAFVRSTGFKLSKKKNQQYFSYDLVRDDVARG